MTKLFASDSEIWGQIRTCLASPSTVEAVEGISGIIDTANQTLSGLGIASIESWGSAITDSLRNAYDTLENYISTIHARIEEEIDGPFRDGMLNLYADVTMVNPREITVKSDSHGGASIPVLELFLPVAAVDYALLASFEHGLGLIENIRPSDDLKGLIRVALDALMQQHAGVQDASAIPKADVRLLIHYYQLQYPENVHDMQNLINLLGVRGAYGSEIDAISAVAGEMRGLTDRLNMEHSVTIYTMNAYGTEFHFIGGIVAGNYGDVIPATLFHSPSLNKLGALISGNALSLLYNFSVKKTLIHTHPSTIREDNRFSGSPGSRKIAESGDAYVVDYLGYEKIYLVGIDGNVYKYEGQGTGWHQAETRTALDELANRPIVDPAFSNLPQSEIVYLWNEEAKKYEIPVYR